MDGTLLDSEIPGDGNSLAHNTEGRKGRRHLVKRVKSRRSGFSPKAVARKRRHTPSSSSRHSEPDSQTIGTARQTSSRQAALRKKPLARVRLPPGDKKNDDGPVESPNSLPGSQERKGKSDLAPLQEQLSKSKSRPSSSTVLKPRSKRLMQKDPQEATYDSFYTPQNSEFYSKFCYMSLNPGERKVRLLRIRPLEPGEDEGSPIKCEMIDNQYLAAMQGKFTTISYCAGDPKKTEKVVVNGLDFNAFANLGHALRQVRHFWKEKYDNQELLLWADQICIDQSDLKDRSHQVGFMGDIYGSAMQVLVCLSVEGDRNGGFQWLEIFSSNFQEYERARALSDCEDDSDGSDCPVDHGFNFFCKNFNEQNFHRGWDTFFSTILTSPWWPRAWVRQEFLRAPDTYFLAACESMHWTVAAEAMDRFTNATYGFDLFDVLVDDGEQPCPTLSKRSANDCQACFHITHCSDFWYFGSVATKLLNARKKLEVGVPYSLDLVQNLRGMHLCEASNPKDLIYSCFGISTHAYGLIPDYTPNFEFQDLLIQVAQNVIAQSKNLDILRHAYLTEDSSTSSDIPSWVPDWRNIPRTQDVHFHYLPSRSTEHFTFHPDHQSRPSRILQVRGFLVKVLGSAKYQWPKAISSSRNSMSLVCRPAARDGDEVYLLHGAASLFVLRRQHEVFKVINEVLGRDGVLPGVNLLIDELDQMVTRNDPAITLINIG